MSNYNEINLPIPTVISPWNKKKNTDSFEIHMLYLAATVITQKVKKTLGTFVSFDWYFLRYLKRKPSLADRYMRYQTLCFGSSSAQASSGMWLTVCTSSWWRTILRTSCQWRLVCQRILLWLKQWAIFHWEGQGKDCNLLFISQFVLCIHDY